MLELWDRYLNNFEGPCVVTVWMQLNFVMCREYQLSKLAA
jgi:hypothetical protein